MTISNRVKLWAIGLCLAVTTVYGQGVAVNSAPCVVGAATGGNGITKCTNGLPSGVSVPLSALPSTAATVLGTTVGGSAVSAMTTIPVGVTVGVDQLTQTSGADLISSSLLPQNVAVDVSQLTQSSGTDTIPQSFLPGSTVIYPAGSFTASGTYNGNAIFNSSASAWTGTYPQSVPGTSVAPGAFQNLVANAGAGLGTLTTTTSTLNGSSASITLPQFGWTFMLTDGTSSPGNYTAVFGGGYIFSATDGHPIWATKLQAQGFTPTGSSCPDSRIYNPSGFQIGVCVNGNPAAYWDTSLNYNLYGLIQSLSGAPTITTGASCSGTVSSQVGSGYTGGHFVLGTTGGAACSITISGLPTATHGWNCWGSDTSKTTTLFQTNATDLTTACTLTTGATTTSTDVIRWNAAPM